VALLFFLLLAAGTLGYLLIERMSFLDALYMTVITITSVGFDEVQPLSAAGRIFTIALILGGVGTLAYALTRAAEALLESGLFRRGKMLMDIARLSGHVIVCGYGRMGRAVASKLRAQGAACVVIERDPALVEELGAGHVLHVGGDATEESVLQQAGVERAKSLATVLPHDADNLLVTLTARSLNRDMVIIARASQERTESKLLSAGATRVLNPYQHAGRLVALQLLHPSVTEFIEVVSRRGEDDLSLEEIQLAAGSSLAGVPLRDAPIRREMNVIVVGVQRRGAELIFNPQPDFAPADGDVLVVLGRRENLQKLAKLAGGTADRS
jgi:voltage-gated potassium channel